jgi:hypothetical protein
LDDARSGWIGESRQTSPTVRRAAGGHIDEEVGVLTWDFETDAVTAKLKELGGTPQTREVTTMTAEAR